jgi:diguanylate cyclase (GGDEF)-like protein
MLGTCLAAHGHDVTAVEDAESGRDALQTDEFPLVILDWALPGMDGVQLCRWLRGTPQGDASFVLLTTGRSQPGTLPAVLDAGANDYLPKPFTLDSLNVRVAVAERQVEEIRARKHTEEQLTHQALHDPLTDLPNRTLLLDRLQQAVALGRRNRAPVALLFLDLDGFKEVNDTYGHLRGDALLVEVGRRLRRSLRASDTVARLGGDEFALVLPDADADAASIVAEKILAEMAPPFEIDEATVSIGASIGIAVYPEHGMTADSLIRQADFAMYEAKRARAGFVLAA